MLRDVVYYNKLHSPGTRHNRTEKKYENTHIKYSIMKVLVQVKLG